MGKDTVPYFGALFFLLCAYFKLKHMRLKNSWILSKSKPNVLYTKRLCCRRLMVIFTLKKILPKKIFLKI